MPSATHPSRRSEDLVGFLVLACLAGIACWVFRQQFSFSPAILESPSHQAEVAILPPAAPAPPSPWSAHLPEGLVPAGPKESFGPDNLSDKIDGRADLYLAVGFVGLEAQRFAETGDPAAWMEVLVYDMDNARQAFAAFSAQRREESTDLELGDFAYSTPNALFFTRGKYYVEIISASASGKASTNRLAFARGFAEGVPPARNPLPELALLPADGLVPGTTVLYPADGLGFDEFTDLFTASYRVGDTETTAFLAVRPSVDEAEGVAEAYADFLLENGGTEEDQPTGVPGARLFNLFGAYEAILSHGTAVAGAHQADTKEAAEQLAKKLYAKLTESKHERSADTDAE